MPDFLLIHINNQFDITQLITYDKDRHQARQLSADDFKSVVTAKTDIILIIPAAWVYMTESHVASRSADILQKSIPYSIEEELVNDVEDNYYAWNSVSEHQQQVAVISKTKRHQINDFIKKHQLKLSGLYSEAVFCPAKQDQLTLWQDTDRILLRFGPDTAMVTNQQQLPQLISAFGQNCHQLLTNNPEVIDTTAFKTVSSLQLADCCGHLISGQEVNLYRGEDQDTEQQQTPVKLLKPLLAAGVLIISWLTVNIYQAWQLSSDITTLKSQQQQILKDKFGSISATEQRDPFAAMQSRLKQISERDRPSNSLLDGFYFLGEARRQHPQIELKNIRLFDDQLEIQVTAPAISDINSYRQQLQNLAGEYRVNIGVNELTDGVYQSILTMTPR